jgi:hypothetical protein
MFAYLEMENVDKSASAKLAAWVTNNGMMSADLSSLFCIGGACSRYSNSEGWLYRDVDHLSVSGAERAVPLIQTYLK